MVRPIARDGEDRIVETWEVMIEGTVWVHVYDRRDDRYVKQRVGGREGSRRIHITRDDRKYNQERLPDENKGLDPFTNGALRLVDSATRDESLDTRYHMTPADIAELLEIKDEDLFREAVEAIESELIVRRLRALAETDGTVAQNSVLREVCEARWPIGGTQKSVREMIEAGERIGATQVW